LLTLLSSRLPFTQISGIAEKACFLNRSVLNRGAGLKLLGPPEARPRAVQACAIAREAAPFCHPRFCGIAYQELGPDGKPKADAPAPGVTINVRFVSAATPEESPPPEALPDVRRPIEQERVIEPEPLRPLGETAAVSLVQRPVQRCWDENGFSGRPFGRIGARR
jgi:hypothetical protein